MSMSEGSECSLTMSEFNSRLMAEASRRLQDGWRIEEALVDAAFNMYRGSRPETWPRLEEDEDLQKKKDEVLQKKKCEVLQKENEDLQKEKEVLQKKCEDLQKVNEVPRKKKHKNLQKKCEHLQKENEALQKKCEDLQSAQADYKSKAELREMLQKECEYLQKKCENLQSAQADYKSKLELREMLRKYINRHREVNVGLMNMARDKFHSHFPCDVSRKENPTFTGTIAVLVKEKANESIEYKLGLLRDVAIGWDEEMGEQFFILCKSVAQWNNDDFHPAIEGEARCVCKNKARNGMYSVDGVNLEKVVMHLLDA